MELYDMILKSDDPNPFLNIGVHKLKQELNFYQKRLLGLFMVMQLEDMNQYEEEIKEIEKKIERLNECIYHLKQKNQSK